MKAQHIRIVVFLSIAYSFTISLHATIGHSQFTIRSQGLNMPRHMVGMEPFACCEKTEGFPCFYFGITPAFSQSVSSDKLEEYLFFNGTNTMNFGPLGGRETDVFARNFLLNDNFQGSITTKPDIQSMILDVQLRVNLNKITKGLYLETYLPITWSQWDLHFSEHRLSSGTEVAPNKLGNPTAQDSFLKSITRAWMGDTINAGVFPAVRAPMGFATVDGKRTEVALADVYITLGYRFIDKPDWQIDATLNYIAPAGKRPNGRFFFDAQVGNGKHNGLGGGLHGYHQVSESDNTALATVFDIRAYYLFASKQRRTFDLTANGIGSRYLLFKRFQNGAPTGDIIFGPNVTTLDCKVRIGAVVEGTIMATYDWCEWQLNAGANAYLQSKEGITLQQEIPAGTFAIQGNSDSNTAQTASLTRINGDNAETFDIFPVFLSTAGINIPSAQTPLGVSYKVFAHVSRFWADNPWEPFVGFGGEIELSAFSNKVLEQFSVWLKCGFSYV